MFDILFLLLAAVVLVPLFQRFGIPSVLAYLAAGIMLGPHTPGPVIELEVARPLAEFGVVFLLFAIGMELPLSRLRTMRRYILGLGLAQVVVTALLIGGIGHAFGLSGALSLVVGLTLAFSSTATVLAILVERGEAVDHHGRIAVAVLIFQDLAVVPVLVLLPLLAGQERHVAEALALAGGKVVLVMAAIFLVGRFLLRPAYRFIAVGRNPEVFTAANLLLVLTVAWVTGEAGMSMALGAFLAGLLLADSRYRHQVEADIEPFRGLLLGLFFMTVGMSVDLPFVAERLGLVLGLAVGTVAVKAAVLIVLCRLMKVGMGDGLRVGFLLAQGGEFAFVVFGRALELKLLDGGLGQALVASVALSMVLTPALAALGRRLSAGMTPERGGEPIPETVRHLAGHVIIAGYGRVGRAIARLLAEHEIPYIALDMDVDRVAAAREAGLPVYYGDAGRTGILRSVGIGQARAAVITVNEARQAERTISCIRQAAPHLPIVARARDRAQEQVLGDIGATAVIPETVEASLQMAGSVLRQAGIGEEAVERSLKGYRNRRYGRPTE
ncbi:glutathione-regulated potassium-efflux system protein kefB [Paramagnetospirillum caucaseum]|uniref:Glutathione-regulated potassium-efflux system protein kefB n=1 Tax=Paramagnetospirillum caucaseum TaxID=1244869 RepID=M3A9B1_9PROT|nr:glutathione-regulated potassium-efflux system protein kefB [Paramagnetospirillum caucaseum]